MYKHVKLTIFTGKEDFDVVEVGSFSKDQDRVFSYAFEPDYGIDWADKYQHKAFFFLYHINLAIKRIEEDDERFKGFKTEDLLSAKAFLTSLRAACEAHPACKVIVVSL